MKLKTEVGENGANFVALGDPSTFDPKATLAGVCWDTQGNAGTNPVTDFLGTSDNQALNFRVNNARRLMLDASGNSIGGSPSNLYAVGSFGQVIAGGGSSASNCGPSADQSCSNQTTDLFATISGGAGNSASTYDSVGGGISNAVSGQLSTVGGGFANSISQDYATIVYGLNAFVGGGISNEVKGQNGVIGGGDNNYVDAQDGTVGGGGGNNAIGTAATVGGGFSNNTAGNYATIAGGRSNCAGGYASFAGGNNGKVRVGATGAFGTCVSIPSGDADGDEGTFLWSDSSTNGDFVSTGPNQFAVRATGGLRWGGTGVNSTTSPALAHQVNTATNTCDGGSGANTRTYLNHPLLNNNPNAIIVITPNYGTRSTGTSPPLDKTFGLYYGDTLVGGCPAGRWVIYQLNSTATALNTGARFNAWFVIP